LYLLIIISIKLPIIINKTSVITDDAPVTIRVLIVTNEVQ